MARQRQTSARRTEADVFITRVRIHAGLYKAFAANDIWIVQRQRGFWWLVGEHSYRVLDSVAQREHRLVRLGPGNARQFRLLADVWGHLYRLNQRFWMQDLPF